MKLLIAMGFAGVLSLLLGMAAAAMSQPFEGTTWKVVVTPDDDARRAGGREFTDKLVFKGGQFFAESLKARGFEPVECREEMAPGGFTASFTAEPKSKEEGQTHWRGTVTGGEMRGEMKWTKPDGTELHYTFQGERLPR